MALFKTISYSKMLYEALRNYFSVNKNGILSVVYRYILCCLWPMQGYFDSFHIWRVQKKLIANCKWQIGQLTNVLNYIFDSTLNRIFIGQRQLIAIYEPLIEYESDKYTYEINDTISGEDMTYDTSINDAFTSMSETLVNVPTEIYNDLAAMGQLVSVIEQVKISGLEYQIIEI